jgi:hypothetical protein
LRALNLQAQIPETFGVGKSPRGIYKSSPSPKRLAFPDKLIPINSFHHIVKKISQTAKVFLKVSDKIVKGQLPEGVQNGWRPS